MTSRVARRDLRRADRRSARHLPGRAIGPASLPRQTLIGLGAGLVCAGGLICTCVAADRARDWREAAGRALIVLPGADPADPARPDPTRLAAVLSLAGEGAREVPAASMTGLPEAGGATEFIIAPHPAPDLQARLRQAVPGSVVEPDGGAPAQRLAVFGDRLAAAAGAASALVAATAIGVLVLAASDAVRRAGAQVRLLADLGMTPRAIDARLAVPISLAAFLGCAAAVSILGWACRPVWPGAAPVWTASVLGSLPFVAAFATALAGIGARRRLLLRTAS